MPHVFDIPRDASPPPGAAAAEVVPGGDTLRRAPPANELGAAIAHAASEEQRR